MNDFLIKSNDIIKHVDKKSINKKFKKNSHYNFKLILVNA